MKPSTQEGFFIMNPLIIYTDKKISQLVRKRKFETKIGEKVSTISENKDLLSQLLASPTKFVLLGIPEDIGVRANYGRGGAHTCWQPALESFLNTQSNSFLIGDEIMVLGHVKTDDLMLEAEELKGKTSTEIKRLRDLVTLLDIRVSEVISLVSQSGKIPIVIGGGHNNSFPILKGIRDGLKEIQVNKNIEINVVNCDAHADLRDLEGRNSGNGFSYAIENGFLNKYAVLGLHEQYNSYSVIEKFKNNRERFSYISYEDIFVREKFNFSSAAEKAVLFCHGSLTGIELDLDSITNVPSSARTSSGISPIQARQFIHLAANKCNPAYLHIAEGAPILAHIKADNKTGKLVSYLITDFIKSIQDKTN